MAYDTCGDESSAFYSSPMVTYEGIITSLKKHFSFQEKPKQRTKLLTIPLFAFYFRITASAGAILI